MDVARTLQDLVRAVPGIPSEAQHLQAPVGRVARCQVASQSWGQPFVPALATSRLVAPGNHADARTVPPRFGALLLMKDMMNNRHMQCTGPQYASIA